MSDNESRIEEIIDRFELKNLKKKAARAQAAEKETIKTREELSTARRVYQDQRQMIQSLSLATLKMAAFELEQISESNVILNSTDNLELESTKPKESKKSIEELENQIRRLKRKLERYKGLRAVNTELEKLLEDKTKRLCELEDEKRKNKI